MIEQKKVVVKRMNKLLKLIPDTIKAIKELPDFKFCHLSTVGEPGDLQINIFNYNYTEYLKLRRALAKNYVYLGHWFHETLGSYFIELKHNNLDVRLDIQLKIDKNEGSETNGKTCKLVIDHYKEPEPVYRLECE